jgi:acyl-CoA reductase-like NAD-dependent aldehyde dehydrogenase
MELGDGSISPLGLTVPLWLDGNETTTTLTYDVISPSTNQVLYRASSASVDDANRAIESARVAFESWSRFKPALRRDILLRAAEVLQTRKEEMRNIIKQETGEIDSMFDFEFNLAVEACKSVAGLIPAVRGSVPILSEEGRSAMVLQEPYGVVLSVAPWNAPYALGFRACLAPLAMGNTVILKGSEFSPRAYWAIASVFHEAGLPKGCLNTIVHRQQDAAEITSTIILSSHIRKVSFTGSAHVGAIIASQTAKLLKPVLMELGGKAPTIVCDDANIEQAALGATLGSFLHSGQICMSTERVIVHAAVADKFKEVFRKTIDQVFGSPEGLTLVNKTPVLRNKHLLSDAILKGAKVLYGDVNHEAEVQTAMRPVVIENVKEGMDIYHTESFGPTLSLFIVESDDEAVKLANDTEYGLAASVYSENLTRALRIARQVRSGAVHINSMSVHDESALPHGGHKSSGYGRFNGIEGLEEWVQTKTVTWRE